MKQEVVKSQMFAIRLSFVFGIIMLGIKWYAYFLTGSTAIFSDAAESVIHIIGVGFAVFSLWLSIQPPDETHTYGHEKISYFSAGTEGGLIVLAAVYIIYLSVQKIIHGVEVSNLDKGTYFTFSASLINLFLGWFLVQKGKKTNSLILVANGKHVLTDSWTSFGVVCGLLLTWITGWLLFDPIIAIIAALNILWSGGKLIRQSAGGLMDEVNQEYGVIIRKVLDEELESHQIDYHALRYRESGNLLWVEFHLIFPKDTLLQDAHIIATNVESKLKSNLRINAKIISHLETVDTHDDIHDI